MNIKSMFKTKGANDALTGQKIMSVRYLDDNMTRKLYLSDAPLIITLSNNA